jgi:hypothetical protein
LLSVYDNCSKLVHFSSSAMQLILDRRNGFEKSNVNIVISSNEAHFSNNEFNEISKTCLSMLLVLREHMKAQVEGKRLRVSTIIGVEPDQEMKHE